MGLEKKGVVREISDRDNVILPIIFGIWYLAYPALSSHSRLADLHSDCSYE